MNRHANGRRGLIGRVKTAGATICGKCCPYGNPLQSQRVPTAPWKPSAPTLSTDTTAELLTNHNQGVGPFYSIGVGSFYVIEAMPVP